MLSRSVISDGSHIPNPGRVFLASVAIAFVALRFFGLDGSLWCSEAYYFWALYPAARVTWPDYLHLNLYYGWIALFGSDEFVLRLPAVLCSLGTIAVVFTLGKRLFGRRAAWFSAVVMALLPSDFFHAREARQYECMTLLAAWSVWALIRFRERRNLVSSLLLMAALALNIFFIPFFLPILGLLAFLLWQVKEPSALTMRRVIVNMAVLYPLGVATLLVLWRAGMLGVYEGFIRPGSDLRALTLLPLVDSPLPAVQFLSSLAIFVAGPVRLGDWIGGAALNRAIGMAGLVLLAVAFGHLARSAIGGTERRKSPWALLTVWLAGPSLLFIFMQHCLASYPFTWRYALSSTPAVALIVGRYFSVSPESSIGRVVRGALLSVFLVLATTANVVVFSLQQGDFMYAWSRLMERVVPALGERNLFVAFVDDPSIIHYYMQQHGGGSLRADVLARHDYYRDTAIIGRVLSGSDYDRIIILPERCVGLTPADLARLEEEGVLPAGEPKRIVEGMAPVLSQGSVMSALIYDRNPHRLTSNTRWPANGDAAVPDSFATHHLVP